MKKFINKHKTKLLMIVCALFGGTVVASAETVATIFSSSEVSYSNEDMDATNVQDAIDELYEKASSGSTGTAERTISKLNATVVTSGGGLYQDATESDRYIYKGANPNNYIQFNGETWRIYSIESDGSLKIIRNDLLTATRQIDSAGDYGRRTSGYCSMGSAKNEGCNAWAATSNLKNSTGEIINSFVNGNYSGAISEDSAMLTYLNSNTSGSYYYSLTDTAKGQIESRDWNVGPAGSYGDTYTLSQLVSSAYEGKYKWNGKVGLLTKSEYMRANTNTSSCSTASALYSNYSTCKSTNYLYNSSTGWWLISPTSTGTQGVFIALTDGYISYAGASVSNTYGVRPVMFLSSSITLSGSGTNDANIYRISS